MMKYMILSILSLIIYSSELHAQRDYSKVVIKEEQIVENIYMLTGSGGNMMLITGDEATILVDDQFAPLAEKIESKVKELSISDLKYVLNTHWHGDHTGGNEYLGNQGKIIVAHENVRERLSTDQLMKAFSREVKAKPKGAWPQITFNDKMSLYVNDIQVELIHVHHAHTDGDSFVYLPEANVLHMGDCFLNGRFPFIDLGSGGSVKGAIEATEAALMLVDKKTKIIPGHGSIASLNDLKQYNYMLRTIYDRVMQSIKAGDSLETLKSKNLTFGFESYDGGFIGAEKFIDTIWTEENTQ